MTPLPTAGSSSQRRQPEPAKAATATPTNRSFQSSRGINLEAKDSIVWVCE